MIRAYTIPELLAVEDPQWLVEGILPLNSLTALYGQPGHGKSFLALDLALAVASGEPWQGHPIPEVGYVVYVSAEGSGGLKKRVAAWLDAHAIGPQRREALAAHFLLSAIAITPDSEELVRVLEDSIHPYRAEVLLEDGIDPNEDNAPLFIIVDTLARCFVGDENQQEDMGNFIKGLDILRERYNATVLVLHHTKKEGYEERGSSSFRGACDTMLVAVKEGSTITLTCSKQKDFAEFEPLELALVVVPKWDSCVMGVQEDLGMVRRREILNIMTDSGPIALADLHRITGGSKMTLLRDLRDMEKQGKTLRNNDEWQTAYQS